MNRDPYGDGWFYKVKLDDVRQTGDRLTPEQYEQLIAAS